MTSAEFMRYWVPVIFNLPGEHTLRKHKALDELLGVTEFQTYVMSNSVDEKPMAPEVLRACKMLTGPHWKTVLKVLEIRRGVTFNAC
jgi:hypothetical protein